MDTKIEMDSKINETDDTNTALDPFEDHKHHKKRKSHKSKSRKHEKKSKKKKSEEENQHTSSNAEDSHISNSSDEETLNVTKSESVPSEYINDKEIPAVEAQTLSTVSKSAFFASLFAAESRKPATGTIHAVGKKSGMESDKKSSTGDWECPKCCSSNFKQSIQCHKCKAMKRMSSYR
jgi:trehalose/maltose hydrolase-like predicted phosphorylase